MKIRTRLVVLGFAGVVIAGANGAWRIVADTLQALVATPAIASTHLSSGLVGYWPFDEASGTTASDASGGNHPGTLVGGPVWTAGKFGNAVSFDGVDDYVNIPDPNLIEGSSELSVSVWAASNVTLTDNSRGIVAQARGGGGDNMLLQLRSTDNIAFEVNTGGTVRTDANADIADTGWHHYVGVYTGNRVLLYVDGVLQTNQPAQSGAVIASTNPLTIGTYDSGRNWAGVIDEVRIYNRALSATDIQDLYNLTTTSGPPSSDTQAPAVSLTMPTSGTTVSGVSVTVSADASDDVGVAAVQFLLDGASLGSEDTTSPYSIIWDSTQTIDGAHTLTARARDVAGNQTTSAGISVTVGNAAADTEVPTTPIGLTATPVSSSQINLEWMGSTDNVGVVGYRIYRGAVAVGTTSQTRFQNIGLAADTTYTYAIAAYDAAGNESNGSAPASAKTLSLSAPSSWTPPIGIPSPPFGIDDVAPPPPSQWPGAEAKNYYYIDNTHSAAINTNNPYGYPDKPRRTIPEITYAPGAYVEIHGGPYTAGGQLIFTHNGSPSQIMWLRGASSDAKPVIRAETIPKGSYIVMENLLYDTNKKTIGIRVHNGSQAHHIAVRHSEFTGPGTSVNQNSVIAINGNANFRFHDIVIYNNLIREFGDNEAILQNDYHGVKPGAYVDHVWILNNTVYNLGGDSVQVGSASLSAEQYPRFIYIGGNTFHGNLENDVDIKRAYDVIISQNDLGPVGDSHVVVHNGPARVWTIFNTFHGGVGDTAFITTGSTDTYLVGNVIYNNHGSPPDLGGGAIQNRGSSPITVVNNTIHDVDFGLEAAAGTNPIVSRNNIFANVAESLYHIVVRDSGSVAGSALAHTLFHEPSGRSARIRWGSEATYDVPGFQAAFPGECGGCLQGDPQFVNASAGNFALQSGSPAIDTGGVDDVYATFESTYGLSIAKDLAGVSRPQGTGWDIGAYEYVAGAVPP